MTDIYYVYTKNQNDPNFPNKSLYMLYIVNPWEPAQQPSSTPANYLEAQGLSYEPVAARDITGLTSSSATIGWGVSNNVWNSDGVIRNEVLYSLYGYIRGDEDGTLRIVNNGAFVNFDVDTQNPAVTVNNLPAVRYLLPIPQEAIARSNGQYQNYYGF